MASPLLKVSNLTCNIDGNKKIISGVNLTLNEGDILVLNGKSGSGKTTLLKCLAHLAVYEGEILFRGQTPLSLGIPSFRTHVLYVPQRPSLLARTPRVFLATLLSFSSRKSRTDKSKGETIPVAVDKCISLSKSWGIEEQLWDREWVKLSGGESQRISLACAVGIDQAEVLLLDEPTSALDPQSSENVEATLRNELKSRGSTVKAIVWITHSEEQGHRVGTRFCRVNNGTCHEELIADV